MKFRFPSAVLTLILALPMAAAGQIDVRVVPEQEANQWQYGWDRFVLEDAYGDVQIIPAGEPRGDLAREGYGWVEGDRLRIGAGGQTTLALGEEVLLHLGPRSVAVLVGLEAGADGSVLARIKLHQGSLLAHGGKPGGKVTLEVEAAGISCRSRGGVFGAWTDGVSARFSVREGEVRVGEGPLSPGQERSAGQGKLKAVRPLSPAQGRGFERWESFRKLILEKRRVREEGEPGDFDLEKLRRARQGMVEKGP